MLGASKTLIVPSQTDTIEMECTNSPSLSVVSAPLFSYLQYGDMHWVKPKVSSTCRGERPRRTWCCWGRTHRGSPLLSSCTGPSWRCTPPDPQCPGCPADKSLHRSPPAFCTSPETQRRHDHAGGKKKSMPRNLTMDCIMVHSHDSHRCVMLQLVEWNVL